MYAPKRGTPPQLLFSYERWKYEFKYVPEYTVLFGGENNNLYHAICNTQQVLCSAAEPCTSDTANKKQFGVWRISDNSEGETRVVTCATLTRATFLNGSIVF
jgi:hypothetical protein